MQSHDTSNETLPNCPPSPSGPCASLAKPTFYHLPYNNIFILSVQAIRAKHHPESKVLVLVVNITNILLTPPPVIIVELYEQLGAEGGTEQSKAWQIQARSKMTIGEDVGSEPGGHCRDCPAPHMSLSHHNTDDNLLG